jgi:hypothetical protein
MAYIIRWFTSIALVLTALHGLAQSTCTDQLRLAQRRYDSGLLDEIPSIIEPCLEKGFSKEEKSTAYKLLIQTYLFSDQFAKADEVMLKFLNDFPNYTIAANDHKEFINLYKTYRTTPIMKIEASLGGNLTMPWVRQFFGPENLGQAKALYNPTFGVTGEVNYINKVFDGFDGSFGLSFALLRVGYTNTPYEFTTITSMHSNLYVGAPLALRYNKRILRMNLFAKGGLEPVYLLYSSNNLTRTISGVADPITGNENVIDYQKKMDIRPLLSIGLDQKIGDSQIFITAGFRLGTIIPTKSENRFTNEDLFRKYYFVQDDYWIHQAFLSISYVFSIYQPKKIQ